MKGLRYFEKLTALTMGKLCQQRWLLAGLVLLCLLLPLGAGRAAEVLLSRGVNFAGVTLAITAPEGDGVPQLLEQFMGEMEDIAQYCNIVALEEGAALEALSRGEVTAVLVLPERFIQGVMWGENPDLRLIVAGDRPLESLLLLWVGQSASDILSAFQSGVYAVLDLYQAAPPPGLTRDQVVVDINLRYISLATGRADMFQTELVTATQALPIPLHYALSLAAFFALAAAPVFLPLPGEEQLGEQHIQRVHPRHHRQRGEQLALAFGGALHLEGGEHDARRHHIHQDAGQLGQSRPGQKARPAKAEAHRHEQKQGEHAAPHHQKRVKHRISSSLCGLPFILNCAIPYYKPIRPH